MGSYLEPDTLLVVTIILVRHLDEVDSSVSNFGDRKTKVSSRARFHCKQLSTANSLTPMFSVYNNTDHQRRRFAVV